jgi:predicted nucleotidyltransferase
MAVDLSENFARFLANISLGSPQVPRMNRAWEAVASFLVESFEIDSGNVFLQGSYANGTAIEPAAEGEYDIDVVVICAGAEVTANDALDDLERRFLADGRYRDRVRRKQPCVRLEYADDDVGSFHVDVVPVRVGLADGPLDAPRRDKGWKPTAPAEYSAWCRDHGDLFLRTVKMLKRWRAEQQTVRGAIKSIVLQVLVANAMPATQDDAERVAETLRVLQSQLGGLTEPPAVTNPVLPSENLAAGWSNESFRSFMAELDEAVEWSTKALATDDPIEAADLWAEMFGEDFPTESPSDLGLQVGDFSHAQTPEQMGWREAPNANYSVSVSAAIQRGKRSKTRRNYPSGGHPIVENHWLRFKAHIVAPHHVEVWWQVANTGDHARSVGGLRGEIFRGRDVKKQQAADQTENWETTAYTGSHLVRAMLVRDNVAFAKSDWFRVNIYKKGRAFRP